jgi:ABC-type transporter Mla subunit MlaD
VTRNPTTIGTTSNATKAAVDARGSQAREVLSEVRSTAAALANMNTGITL